MNPQAIPIKTAAGRMELDTRTHKLSWQARALLVSIDGEKRVDELAHLFKSAEATTQALAELLALGFVEEKHVAVELPALNSGEGITSLQQARQLLNDTAVGSLGMLGGLTAFRFTLKLERCYTPESLREVFPEYRRMVAKSKGEDFVQAVLARVEELLAQG